MTKWRPKGWFNHFTKEAGNLHPEADKEANIYEAGADAMWESLRKSAVRHPLRASGYIGTVWYDPLTGTYPSSHGVWVFIPDDKEEK